MQPSSSPALPSAERDPRQALIVTEASGPYAHLSQQELAALNAELLDAERSYTQRFRDCDAMSDAVQRQIRWDGLRNSFGTKQSNIRKKYGVKLRERRTKAEIDAEKARMGLDGSRGTASPMVNLTPSRLPLPPMNAAPVHAAPIHAAPVPAAAAAAVAQPPPPPPAQQTPVPVPEKYLPAVRSAGWGNGWTAANAQAQNNGSASSSDEAKNAKRQRTDANGNWTATSQLEASADESYARKQASARHLAMAAIQNVNGNLATAAEVPTSKPSEVYQQAVARGEIHQPQSANASDGTASANGSSSREEDGPSQIVIDDDATDSSSESSDDADIPAVLPAHVKQSLSSRVAV
jgi:hypothetical protein